MKRCPTCNRTFADESVGFCIDDGTALVQDNAASSLESQATAILPGPPPTMQMPPPRATEYVAGTSPNAPSRQPYGWANESPAAWTPPPPPGVSASKPQQGLAVASLVLGIVSMTVGWCCYFGVLTGPIAVALGIFSLVQIKNNPSEYTGKPLAIIGIATGALYFVLLALIVLIKGMSFLAGGLG
jgi:uncharacterized protein DUF4190